MRGLLRSLATVIAIVATTAHAGPVEPPDVVVDHGEDQQFDTLNPITLNSLTIGATTGTSTATIGQYQTLLVNGATTLGAGPDSSGSLNLGGGSLESKGGITIGQRGTGLVEMNGFVMETRDPEDLASVPSGPLVIGAGTSGRGTVNVRDGFLSAGEITVGQGDASAPAGVASTNSGTLQVSGLTSASGTDAFVGRYHGGNGDLVIGGGSASLSVDSIYIGGDRTGPGGVGLLDLRDGSANFISANKQIVVWSGGTLRDDGGGFIYAHTVLDGGTLRGGGLLYGGITSHGGTLRGGYGVYGDVVLDADSHVVIDVFSPFVAGFYDATFDTALLDGELIVQLGPNILGQLTPENSFIAFSGETLQGKFANAPDGGRIAVDSPDGQGSFRVRYLRVPGFESDQVMLDDFRAVPGTVIPLPPGVWTGMTALTAMALASGAATARAGRLRG